MGVQSSPQFKLYCVNETKGEEKTASIKPAKSQELLNLWVVHLSPDRGELQTQLGRAMSSLLTVSTKNKAKREGKRLQPLE